MQIDRATELSHIRNFGALRLRYDQYGTGPKIGSVNLPNFRDNNEGCTYSKPTRSDEEILKDIAEMAKKHAENGTFHHMNNEYLDLYKEYVSSVSPDREGILTNSLKEIFGKTNKSKEEPTIDLNKSILQQTLKIMEQAKNKNGANRTWLDGEIKGANYNVGWMEGNELKYADFFDSNGEKIACYTQNGWDLFGTKAEKQRGDEFTALYNETFKSVNTSTPTASLPKSVDVGNTFDVVG
jgi:hypothetical protein